MRGDLSNTRGFGEMLYVQSKTSVARVGDAGTILTTSRTAESRTNDAPPAILRPTSGVPERVALYYPNTWKLELHRSHDMVALESLEWAYRHDIASPGCPQMRRIRRMMIGHFVGHCWPNADRRLLQLFADFLVAYLLVDDLFETRAESISPKDLPEQFEICLDALAGPAGAPVPKNDPLLAGCAEVRDRFWEVATDAWMKSFRSSLHAYFFRGLAYELDFQRTNRWPSLDDYLGYRTHTSGTFPVLNMCELADDCLLSEEQRISPDVRLFDDSVAVAISIANDLLSFDKEQDLEQWLNYLQILGNEQRCDLGDGQFYQAADRHDETIVLVELLRRRLAARGQNLASYAESSITMLRGVVEWQVLAARYNAARRLRVELESQSQIFDRLRA